MNTKQNAFTLIELLVVIAIIAILAISIAVGYQSVRKSANDAKRIETARSIITAQELYRNANDEYATCYSWHFANGTCDLVNDGYLAQDPLEAGISRSSSNPDLGWHFQAPSNSRTNGWWMTMRNTDGLHCVTPNGISECSSTTDCWQGNCM